MKPVKMLWRRRAAVAVGVLATSFSWAASTTPASAATPECAYLPAVNVGSCRITTAPPAGATGVRVVSATFPSDPGNIDVALAVLAPPPGIKTLTIAMTGTVNVVTPNATLSQLDVTCLDSPKAGLYHRSDGISADGIAAHLFKVRVQACGRHGIYLAHATGSDLAEVNVGRTGLRMVNTATVPHSQFAAIELNDVRSSFVLGVGIGNWTNAGQSGAPTAAGIALTGGSANNVLASVFVAGHSAEVLNGVATGPAVLIDAGSTRNQVVRSRVRYGAKNAQRVVCRAGTADNLWHHDTFDFADPACLLGDTPIATGNGSDHGDPEAPDPSSPAQRRYSPRVWTVCMPTTFQGSFCDDRHPGSNHSGVNPEVYRNDLATVITSPTAFVPNVAANPNRFLPGDIILADTFPVPGPADYWNGFTIPAGTPLWLVGNTRTQQGNYLYTVAVRSATPPDIGPPTLPAADGPKVRIQHIFGSAPSNAVVIDRQDRIS